MSLHMTLTFDTRGIKVLLDTMDKWSSKQALTDAMHDLGLTLVRHIVGFTPVRTGGAKGAVQLQKWGSSGATVVGALSYWPGLEEGTRAHIIRPKNAKVLAFGGGAATGKNFGGRGGTVFAKFVRHPGTKGVHAFRDGLEQTGKVVIPTIKKYLDMP